MEDQDTRVSTDIVEYNNPSITMITEDDRTDQNALTPAARERVLDQIQNYIRKTGSTNINAIKRMLGVNWDTAKNLMKQAAERTLAETDDLRSYQADYYYDCIQEIRRGKDEADLSWVKYGIHNKREEEEVLTDFFDKLDKVLKLKYTPDGAINANPGGAMSTAMFNFISPGVADHMRATYGVNPAEVISPNNNVTISNDSLPPVTSTPVTEEQPSVEPSEIRTEIPE
jgi:hypothetical protein